MSDEETTDLLVITQFFPPESMGGAHRWERISEHLDDSVEPHVLTTFPTFPFGEFDRRWKPLERETVSGIPVTRLFTYQPTSDSTIGRILNYAVFSLLSTLYVLCTFWRYDCIVTMSAPHTTFLPGLVGKLTGRAWVIDIFDLWLDNAADLGYVDKDSIFYKSMAKLERLSFAKADAVTVITETMSEYYQEKYSGMSFDIHIVPFGIDTNLFSPDVEPANSADVIYTGNFGTGQAFKPFLRGFAQVESEPELLLVGGGERRMELERFISDLGIDDRVTFEGYVDRKEIPRLLAGAKISLVPLKTDHKLDYAKPTKLLETMAVGTPYIASNVGEISNVSEHDSPGFAVPNEEDAVRDAINQLLTDTSTRSEMGLNGVRVIQNQHHWPTIGDHITTAVRSDRSIQD